MQTANQSLAKRENKCRSQHVNTTVSSLLSSPECIDYCVKRADLVPRALFRLLGVRPQLYCVKRAALVPLLGVRLQMHCAKRAGLVPLLGGRLQLHLHRCKYRAPPGSMGIMCARKGTARRAHDPRCVAGWPMSEFAANDAEL